MTIEERLRQLASALPSKDSAVSLTREDIITLLDTEPLALEMKTRDMTVEEVGEEVGRAPSTIRGWLIAGELRGYKLNGKSWRVPRAALREYLEAQTTRSPEPPRRSTGITSWRRVRGLER